MSIADKYHTWRRKRGAQKEEAAATSRLRTVREAELIQRHNLTRDPSTPGRYLTPSGDSYIDVDLDSEESVGWAHKSLTQARARPKVRKLTRQQKTQKPATGVRGTIGTLGDLGQNFNANFDPFGGAGTPGLGIGDYDFFGGPTKPAKRKTAKRKKKSTKRK